MASASSIVISKARTHLAAGSLTGAAIGFAYDSGVLLMIGVGPATDAYFLALSIVLVLPTIFYLTATNVLVPQLQAANQRPASRLHATHPWILVAAAFTGVMIAASTPISHALSVDGTVQTEIRRCFLALSPIPLLAAIAEFRRGRLLAAGLYQATAHYVIARNVGTILAALVLLPTSALELGICLVIGYVVQAVTVHLFARRLEEGKPVGVSDPSIWKATYVGLAMQSALVVATFVPLIIERAVAGRLGTGFPTVFSYSYRITSMLGALTITSATIPALAKLSAELSDSSRTHSTGTLKELFKSAVELAIPATLLLVVVAAPLGAFLLSDSHYGLVQVLPLYALSVIGAAYTRPWGALEYARKRQKRVFLATGVQALGSALVAASALKLGVTTLALGPVIGSVCGACFVLATAPASERSVLRAVTTLQPDWLMKWGMAALIAGAFAALSFLLGGDRMDALVGCVLTSASFIVSALLLRVVRLPIAASQTHPSSPA